MPAYKTAKIKLGITVGDPSGVGPTVTLKAIHKLKGLADFIVIADRWVLEQAPGPRLKSLDLEVIDLKNIQHKNFKFGKISARYGKASIEYLDKALELIRDNRIEALVTCPISKEAINLAGFNYSGHTEYLRQNTHAKDIVMMLLNKHLRFSLVTRHVPLKDVFRVLDKDTLAKTICITHGSLKSLFCINNPRIVVCGLNPHASDNGIIGNEENRIIKPVLISLKDKIGYIDGPLPADIAIRRALEKKYDCVIAMYHDQALIPLKLFPNLAGVNLTLGLTFVRTSPLHGTAFDIAGTDMADPSPLMEAIRLALKCTLNRRKN